MVGELPPGFKKQMNFILRMHKFINIYFQGKNVKQIDLILLIEIYYVQSKITLKIISR